MNLKSICKVTIKRRDHKSGSPFCFILVAYSPGTVKSIHFKFGKNC